MTTAKSLQNWIYNELLILSGEQIDIRTGRHHGRPRINEEHERGVNAARSLAYRRDRIVRDHEYKLKLAEYHRIWYSKNLERAREIARESYQRAKKRKMTINGES